MQNRTVFIQKKIYYITLLLFVMTTIAGWFGAVGGNTTIKINKMCTEQEITGWGTSACWWSQIAGDSKNADEFAKLLYSKEGLGLNIYRYNIGGGEKQNPDYRIAQENYDWRATESFLVYNDETGEYEYDWSQDAAAQKMLEKCLDYGCVDTVVLFANSPHFSMTVSGNATGGHKAAQSNLKKECYQDYAEYFLDITEYFIEKGVPVKYISPINEPQWDWGGDWVGQEGCHYEIDEVIEVAKVFAKEIKSRNLNVKLSMAESGQVGDHAMDCMEKLYADEEIASVMGTYSYHSYWTDKNFSLKQAFGDYLDNQYPGVEVEMSEWCELPNERDINDIQAGLLMARTISEDVTLTGANSWTSWVAVNDGLERADSMIGANHDCSEYIVGKRYYAMAHYSMFVPAGSYAVDADLTVGDTKVEKAGWKQKIDGKEYPVYLAENFTNVSCFKTPDGKYVAVIVNEGDSKKVNFNMLTHKMSVYTTDENRNLENTYNGRGYEKITIGANSITTVVFD